MFVEILHFAELLFAVVSSTVAHEFIDGKMYKLYVVWNIFFLRKNNT